MGQRLKTAKRLKEYMTEYYIGAKTARSNNKKVGWITSGGPVEFLIAMDIIPVYPENHGAMIGATHQGGMLCEFAERRGFSRDVCSYARSDIGGLLSDDPSKKGPIGGLPLPDMLVCCNNICGTVMKWYETVSRYLDVPLYIIDTPVIHRFPIAEEVLDYVAEQFKGYVKFLEEVMGTTMDMDRLMEVSIIANENVEIWNSVLRKCTARPTPMTAFDAFTHMAPIVTLRGTRGVTEYYKALIQELDERIEKGIGAVDNERYRLLWDNIPVWHKMRALSNYFDEKNAALVADTYTNAWATTNINAEEEDDIFKAYAKAYTPIYLNIGIDSMLDTVERLASIFDVDGLVLHSNRSCKPYSIGQYDIARRYHEDTGKPSVIIEGDMTDERTWSEAQVMTRLDAFMEMLEANQD